MLFRPQLDFPFKREYSAFIQAPEGLLKNLIFTYNLFITMKFFHGLGAEFQKIVWPKTTEAFGHAVLVIGIAVLVGYYLGALDAGFSALLRIILGF